MLSPDLQRIQHIQVYCERIIQTVNRCEKNYDVFAQDIDYFQSVSMSMMQLGEHSIKLSKEFKDASKDQVPWKEIHGMRVMYAHNYEVMTKAKIWSTAVHDVPPLLEFCKKVLEQNREKESQPPKKKPSIIGKMEQYKKTVSEQSDKQGKNKTNDQEIE